MVRGWTLREPASVFQLPGGTTVFQCHHQLIGGGLHHHFRGPALQQLRYNHHNLIILCFVLSRTLSVFIINLIHR